MEFAELPIRRAEVSFFRHVPSQDIDGWQRIHFEGYKTTSKADNAYFLSILREAIPREKCSFFYIVQTGGRGVIPMFKNYVVNFV